jgi:hypothetical protein
MKKKVCPGTTVYAVGEVPLTQARAAAIAAGTDSVADITCIPAYEFSGFAGDVTLGAMPLLATIGAKAFRYFKGTLTLDAGACPLLTSFGDNAFSDMSNPASTVSLSNLTGLTSASFRYDISSFYQFAGTTPLTGPFTSWTGGCTNIGTPGANVQPVGEVPLTQARAAAIAAGTDSIDSAADITCIPASEFGGFAGNVTLGAMPLLATIGDEAFKRLNGKLTMHAGACPLLTSIGVDAFNGISSISSTVSLSNLTQIVTIGYRAFSAFKGILQLGFASLNQFDFTTFTGLQYQFSDTSNSKSYIILPFSGYGNFDKIIIKGGYKGRVIFGDSTTSTTTTSITTTTIAPGTQCSSTDTFHNTTDADRAAAAAADFQCTDRVCRFHCCALGTPDGCRACTVGTGACYDHCSCPIPPASPPQPKRGKRSLQAASVTQHHPSICPRVR